MKRILCGLLAVCLLWGSAWAAGGSPLETVLLEDTEFSYYIEGTRYEFDSGMLGYARKGYLLSEQLDPSRGKSLKIGIDAVPPAGQTSSPYVVCNTKSDTNLTAEFSVYLSGRSDYRLAVYRAAAGSAGSKESNLIRWREQMEIGPVRQDYETESWHTLRVEIDLEADVFRVWMDGAAVAESCSLAGFGHVDSIRFYGHTNEKQPSFMAVDDLRITTMAKPPEISEIGYDSQRGQTVIPAGAKVIEVYLTQSMYRVTAQQIHLLHEGAEVRLEKAGYDRDSAMAALCPAVPLLPNARYEVVIDGRAELLEGSPLGTDITGSFRTDAETVCVTSAEFGTEPGGVTVTARLLYTEKEDRSLDLFASVWRGERFVRLTAAQETVPAGGAKEAVLEAGMLEPDERLEFYAWKDLMTPGLYADRIYIYKPESE